MGQKCQVCVHPKVHQINRDHLNGASLYEIEDKYGVNYQAVWRHMQLHLPETLVKEFQLQERKHAQNIIGGIEELLEKTKNILDKAEQKGQKRLALDAIKEARSTYELLSKIAVKLNEYQDKQKAEAVREENEKLSQGLQTLSTPELETLTQLHAKLDAADPDYLLDRKARMVVSYGSEIGLTLEPETENEFNEKIESFDRNKESYGSGNGSEESPPDENGGTGKSESKEDSGLQLDGLDDLGFDPNRTLNLDETIPSEETD